MIHTVRLPGGDVAVPRLGFGCAYLVGGTSQTQSSRIIGSALDAGIRHFDVAPVYGLGTAEAALGRALGKRRAEVSVASKVGLPRPQAGRAAMLLRRLPAPVRGILRRIREDRQALPALAAAGTTGIFDTGFVSGSVNSSLQALGTDYLDLLLLHEVRLTDITPELLSFLYQGKHRGRFRAVGVGSDRREIERIAAAYPGAFDVFQYSWSVMSNGGAVAVSDAFNITHRAVLNALASLTAKLASDRALCTAMSDAVGFDLRSPTELPQVLLGAALAANPEGMTLFATRRAARISLNARVLAEPAYLAAGAKLLSEQARWTRLSS